MSKKLTSLVISIILLSLIPTETTSGSDIDLSLPLGFESISPAQSSVIYDDHFDLKGRLKDSFQAQLVKFKGEPVEIVDNGFEVKDIRLKEGINTFLIDMTDVNGRRRLVSYSISSEKKKLNLGGGSLVETAAFNTGLLPRDILNRVRGVRFLLLLQQLIPRLSTRAAPHNTQQVPQM
jgi:hypothetical protein